MKRRRMNRDWTVICKGCSSYSLLLWLYHLFQLEKNLTYHKPWSLEAKWHDDNSERQVQSPENRAGQGREKEKWLKMQQRCCPDPPHSFKSSPCKVAASHRRSLALMYNSSWFAGHAGGSVCCHRGGVSYWTLWLRDQERGIHTQKGSIYW